MSDKRILYISQEIAPYLPSGPLSDLGRDLPQGIMEKGYEVRTFMPRYGTINERRNQLHEVIRLSGMNIAIDDSDHPLILKVASMHPTRIQVYFIDNDDYFQKSSADEDPVGSNRKDNDERAIFFARGTSETLRKLRWEPMIIHCSGWITALTPLYIRHMYAEDASLRSTKIIYTVQPGECTAPINPRILDKLKADGVTASELRGLSKLPADTNLLHRIAISASDAVVVNTPDLAPELQELIAKKKLPVLPYETLSSAEGVDAYADFYNTLCK